MLEKFEVSANWARRATRSENPRYWVDAALVAALFRLGREKEIEAAKRILFARKPDFSLCILRKMVAFPSKMINALRDAGLPEE